MKVISVENLSKSYRLGQIGSGTFFRDFERWLARVRGRPDPYVRIGEADHGNRDGEEIWALRDVSFEVQQGEVLGIIGRNGAGKSTLLKILSQVTAPTSGEIKVRGRIASLLEVGTGFHPELTGRENIYLNGAILGMTRAEVRRKFDEIVDFAGIAQFIDTPVKRYSSGMYVRLAFAVAAHLEPEILVVDEVLAVGDAEFQKKCLGKMGEVAKEGRTVLFVSHNMAAIRRLCPKCVWIDQGLCRKIDATVSVINDYLTLLQPKISTSGEIDLLNWLDRYGSGEARIVQARLLNNQRQIISVAQRLKPLAIEFIIDSQSLENLHLSAVITSDSEVRVLHLSHYDSEGFTPGVIQGRRLVYLNILSLPLSAGNYSITLAIHTILLNPIDVVVNAIPFVVEDTEDSPRPYKTVVDYGYCWTPNSWTIASIAE